MDGNELQPNAKSLDRRHRAVGILLSFVVVGMLGLSYAAVPLYKLFCQATGFGGTTQRAEKGSDIVLKRQITIRFDANIARDLKWRFKPVQNKMKLSIGENGLAFFKAANLGNKTLTGTATFNVTPEAAGSYFNKIACFCFTEQSLKPGQSVDMPVSFFIDPEITKDPETRNIEEITLSYTFFPVKNATGPLAGKVFDDEEKTRLNKADQNG